MNRLKKHRGKITAVLILALLLIIAYFGNRETTKDNKSEIKTNEQKSLILPQNKADFVNNADEKTVVKTESDAENKTNIISESELDDEKEITSEENNPDEETEITSEENNPDEETEIKQKEKSKVDETTADKTDFKVNSELTVNEAPDAENKKTI